MEDQKPWYTSRTIWAGIVTVGSAAAGAFGLSVGAETQSQIVDYITIAVTALAGLAAIFGRIKASQKIK